ncbi:MAG: FAD-binding oxidoreductase [Burkholderiales bacterium]|jgi:alkyldihydroxyacetonephosphate synthase|nr:FAD-binding oxidoreductase [Burkholderiales bacterium]
MNIENDVRYHASSSRTDLDSRALAAELAAIVGQGRVHHGSEARRRYTGDMSWLTYVHSEFGRPLSCQDVLVSPRSTEQVAGVLKLASRIGVPVTPAGGASGVQGAANATRGGILLSLLDMKEVRRLDRTSLTCTVESGMIVKPFEDGLNREGLSFTHYPASAEWASIGGCVAARGSGVLSTKYGTIQDHILSLEVVLPGGDVVDLPVVPRHAVGPDLTQLFAGSEGTLGVITAVTVRLRRVPLRRAFCAFRFETLTQGIESGRQIMTSGLRPAVMRLYDKEAAVHSLERAVRAGLVGETMLIMVDGDHPNLVDAEMSACRAICAAQGGLELNPGIGEAWWSNRYSFYHPPHAPQLPQIWGTMDAVADFTHIEAVYRSVTGAMRAAIDPAWGMTLKTHLSHWYEWGSMIYPRFVIPKGPADLDEAVALHDSVVRAATLAAIESGGVMNDHHGVGMRLAPYLERQLGQNGLAVLRKLKDALDPGHILCPGKLALDGGS